VHVSDNPGLCQDCQGGETVRYDAEWDDLKGKIKGINVSVRGAGSVGAYGGRGGKGGGKFGKGKGGNGRSAASASTFLTHSRAKLMSYRSVKDPEASFASIRDSVLSPERSMLVRTPCEVNGPGVGDSFWRRFRENPEFQQYHIPDFSFDDGEPAASWQLRARALLTEWNETFQRQTDGAEPAEGAPRLYLIHSEQAV